MIPGSFGLGIHGGGGRHRLVRVAVVRGRLVAGRLQGRLAVQLGAYQAPAGAGGGGGGGVVLPRGPDTDYWDCGLKQ